MILTTLMAATFYGRFVTGNDVLENCRNLNDGYPSPYCAAYISGAVDTYSVVAMASDRPLAFCLAEKVNTRQLRDIVVTYLEGNPEIRHFSGAVLVHSALVEGFPCSGK